MVSRMTGSAPQTRPSVHVSERRWVLAFALGVMLLTTLPYLLAYTAQGQDWRFTGFVFAVEDGNSYIAKMLSGTSGAWLFRTSYSTLPQPGVLAYLPFLLLGKLAAPPALHEQLVVLFHLFRFVAGCLAIMASYDFIAYFVREQRLRRYGIALVVLGGGLGWVLLMLGVDSWLGSLPLEFYSPETFGFLELYGFPHLALARAAMLWGLLIYLRATGSGVTDGWRTALKVGALWLLAALCQPLTALCMGAVIGVHLMSLAVWNLWRRLRSQPVDWGVWRRMVLFAVKAALLPLPFLLYNTLAFSLDPFLKVWTAQNRILSPPFPLYLLAYAVLLPFLPFGVRNLLRYKPRSGWLLVGWVLVAPLLAYVPVNLQRRLVEGVFVALVIIALWSVSQPGVSGVRWRTFVIITLLVFPSTLVLLLGGITATLRPDLPLFRPVQEVQAFESLRDQTAAGSVIIASYATGNALPAWAPLRVVIGHGPETAGLDELQADVQRFYGASTSDSYRRQLLERLQVSYVFHGPLEQKVGEWQPDQADYLSEIIHIGPYAVYKAVQ